MIYETAPAKINFTLDTLFKRDDGYDNSWFKWSIIFWKANW